MGGKKINEKKRYISLGWEERRTMMMDALSKLPSCKMSNNKQQRLCIAVRTVPSSLDKSRILNHN